MEELKELEITLLYGLITKYPSLASHIPSLRVANRVATDVGMVVHLIYDDAQLIPELSDIDALYSNQERIHVKGLKNGLGYVIDVTEGRIMFIEFMTYDEKWNGKFDDCKIIPKTE